jgi:hypothetical protein
MPIWKLTSTFAQHLVQHPQTLCHLGPTGLALESCDNAIFCQHLREYSRSQVTPYWLPELLIKLLGTQGALSLAFDPIMIDPCNKILPPVIDQRIWMV